MKQYVIYRRVSTFGQGKSGLGLDAQYRDISIYLENYSEEPYEVIAEFMDLGSGADDDRKELNDAIDLARKSGAELLVAKLDRLSRRVSFIAKLIEDKQLNLRVACMPNADNFQLHIYAALAQQERDFISIRTKQALAEAKARGQVLGGLRDKTGERNKALQKEALDRAEKLRAILVTLRYDSGWTMKAIADHLNEHNYTTARGGKFTPMQVKRTLDRLAKADGNDK